MNRLTVWQKNSHVSCVGEHAQTAKNKKKITLEITETQLSLFSSQYIIFAIQTKFSSMYFVR